LSLIRRAQHSAASEPAVLVAQTDLAGRPTNANASANGTLVNSITNATAESLPKTVLLTRVIAEPFIKVIAVPFIRVIAEPFIRVIAPTRRIFCIFVTAEAASSIRTDRVFC
jgi:hypothetical protein